MNPRSLAPAAFEGLKLMCGNSAGFDATVRGSAAASTVALDTDWRPSAMTCHRDMTEATARAVRPLNWLVPVQPD